jgi:putative flippase GtrA
MQLAPQHHPVAFPSELTAPAPTGTRGARDWVALLGRHQLGSLAATLLDFAVMTAVVGALGTNAEVGTVAGAATGAMGNFLLGRHWVFHGEAGRPMLQARRYAAVSLASLVFNTLGEYVLHERGGVQYQLARVVVAVAVSLLWNFPMQRHFVFGAEPRTTSS